MATTRNSVSSSSKSLAFADATTDDGWMKVDTTFMLQDKEATALGASPSVLARRSVRHGRPSSSRRALLLLLPSTFTMAKSRGSSRRSSAPTSQDAIEILGLCDDQPLPPSRSHTRCVSSLYMYKFICRRDSGGTSFSPCWLY